MLVNVHELFIVVDLVSVEDAPSTRFARMLPVLGLLNLAMMVIRICFELLSILSTCISATLESHVSL